MALLYILLALIAPAVLAFVYFFFMYIYEAATGKITIEQANKKAKLPKKERKRRGFLLNDWPYPLNEWLYPY